MKTGKKKAKMTGKQRKRGRDEWSDGPYLVQTDVFGLPLLTLRYSHLSVSLSLDPARSTSVCHCGQASVYLSLPLGLSLRLFLSL